MQQAAAQAYQQTAKTAADPRDYEAQVLIKSAQNLQRIRNDWEANRHELADALLYNRKLWTVFLDTVTKDDNPLPKAIRQNVANLGIFILGHTVDVQSSPSPEKLDVLININRELAAGLRAKPA